MNEDIPETRAEARAMMDEPVTYEAELVGEGDAFLPLAFRRALYVASLVGAVVAPVLAVSQPDYAAAIATGSGVLAAAAAGAALANPRR
ncbi:hypothetical protein ACIGEP_15485 [Microbacterium sp. NPDC077663]|uniref:hypothetical protein n=1 Tax=Microbacterium sp. NPDC077663 TaxID=3364189 RepID=UPI0037C97DF4